VIGEVVGSYRITQKLSVGGMGTVYRAVHVLIGRDAAIKVLHPELSSSHDIVQRFFNEAKATTSIKHPGIVEVFDFGYMESGHAYLVMEFLEGMSLARRLKLLTERMSEGEAALMLRSVCNALAAAHAKGIIHRDLKPDNLFLVPDPEAPTGERPKILDFGIAKLTDIGLAGTATKTGAVMGTPTYMSPEQCRGTGIVDARADLYSLGCIYYELLCGRPPFNEIGAGELIGAHLFVEPPPPTHFNSGISPDSNALIMALLQKRPEQRPQTATDLARLFGNIAQRHGWVSATRPTAPNLADQPTVIGTPLEIARLTPPPPSLTTPYGRAPTPSPIVHLTPPPPVMPAMPSKPTTLSGAASQSIVDVPGRRSRRGLIIGIAAVVLAAAAGIMIIGFTGDQTEIAPAAPTKSDVAPKTDLVPPSPKSEVVPTPVKSDVPPPPDANTEVTTTDPEPDATKVEPKKPPAPRKPPPPPKKPKTEPEKTPTLIETDID
jgi:serine/threonine protein kinase